MNGWDKEKISQLQLPDPNDTDLHPRLLLDGYGTYPPLNTGIFVRSAYS